MKRKAEGKALIQIVLSAVLIAGTLAGCGTTDKPKPSETAAVTQNAALTAEEKAAEKNAASENTAAPKEADKSAADKSAPKAAERFQPGDSYGKVVPYLGDFRYCLIESSAEDYYDYLPIYGLKTADGDVITDAVYQSVDTYEGLIVLFGEKDVRTVLPESGKWSIEVDFNYAQEGCGIAACQKQNRIYVINNNTMSGYDYNGKKLFTVQGKYFSSWDLIEETGCILINVSTENGDTVRMLDKNGKELWTVDGRAGFEWDENGKGNSHYFECNGGVLNRDGSWLIEPQYNRTQVYGDKYFVCDDGIGTTVFDEHLKELAYLPGSGIDAPSFRLFNGELLRSEFDADTRELTYYFVDGSPVAAKGKTMVSVRPIEGTKLFFGVDTEGCGYFYTRDGAVKKTYPDAVSAEWGLIDGQVTVITGDDQKQIAHVIDAAAYQEIYSYTHLDKAAGIERFANGWAYGGETKRLLRIEEYTYRNGKEEPHRYFVLDLKTGKTVVDDSCENISLFEFNGKAYCSYEKNKEAVLVDENGTVLFKRPISN